MADSNRQLYTAHNGIHLILFLHRYIGIAVRLYICNTIGGKNEPYTINSRRLTMTMPNLMYFEPM